MNGFGFQNNGGSGSSTSQIALIKEQNKDAGFITIIPAKNYYVGFTNAILGTPTNYLSSSLKPLGYINPAKNIAINIPGIYTEFETPATATLADNSTGTIQVGDTIQNKTITITYDIVRGGLHRTGVVTMTSKPGTDISDVPLFDDPGVTFTKTITGSAMILGWATTNTGIAATLNYQINRIMR
jgi:hypothetical protein